MCRNHGPFFTIQNFLKEVHKNIAWCWTSETNHKRWDGKLSKFVQGLNRKVFEEPKIPIEITCPIKADQNQVQGCMRKKYSRRKTFSVKVCKLASRHYVTYYQWKRKYSFLIQNFTSTLYRVMILFAGGSYQVFPIEFFPKICYGVYLFQDVINYWNVTWPWAIAYQS